MTLFLSRLILNRAPGTDALRPLLDPDGPGALDAHHRLLWTLFSDGPDRRRDFLWRAEGGGRFLVLSARPPASHDLFSEPEVKEFAPELAPGDHLAFALRANATKDRAAVSRLDTGARRGKSRRVDLVMDALRAVPPGARAAERMVLAQAAAEGWLKGLGTRHGFNVETVTVGNYSTPSLSRGRGRFGILDLTGTLTVRNPDAFLLRLGQGFGRARAFGCGLMLIRRA